MAEYNRFQITHEATFELKPILNSWEIPTGYRIDLFCDDLRQKLTINESGLQGLKAKVEANEVHAERDVRNDLDRVRIPGDTGMERSRNVCRRAVYTLHVL